MIQRQLLQRSIDRRAAGSRGYSLVELIIGFTVAIIVLLVLLQTCHCNT